MGDDYRSRALELYGEQCWYCGTTQQVKVHHMDGDHANDHRDNWVPLCQDHHLALHRGAPPYTIWFALAQPVIRALDEMRDARGYRSRSEVVARLLEEADDGDLSPETWALLATHNDTVQPAHDI